jgi:hypothetical protein
VDSAGRRPCGAGGSRRLLAQAVGAVRYDVVPAAADEMLWAADLVGWAHGARG